MKKNQSTVQSRISFKVTSSVIASVHSEPITTLPFDASPSRIDVIVGSVFGGVVIVFILPLAFIIRHRMVKRKKTRKQGNDLALAKAAPGERPDQVQDNNQHVKVGDGNETDHPDSSADEPEETTVPVQESGENVKDKTGIQETKLPGRHGDTGKSRLKCSSTT